MLENEQPTNKTYQIYFGWILVFYILFCYILLYYFKAFNYTKNSLETATNGGWGFGLEVKPTATSPQPSRMTKFMGSIPHFPSLCRKKKLISRKLP